LRSLLCGLRKKLGGPTPFWDWQIKAESEEMWLDMMKENKALMESLRERSLEENKCSLKI